MEEYIVRTSVRVFAESPRDARIKAKEVNGSTTSIVPVKQMPSVATQAKNAVSAVGQAIKNPTPVSNEEKERRLAICHACEFLVDGKRCLKCGCTVKWKALLEAWHCPISKW